MPSENALTAWSPYALAALRIMSALLLMGHGTMKLFAFPAPMEIEFFSLMGLAGILEVFGGALLVVGLFTRPVAFVLSGFMAVAYFMAHAPQGFYPALNQGDAAVLFSFIFFYLVFAGAGAFSLDALRQGQTGSLAASTR
jgi:putative oxidoreductase